MKECIDELGEICVPIITIETVVVPRGIGLSTRVNGITINILNDFFGTSLSREKVKEIFKEAIVKMEDCTQELGSVFENIVEAEVKKQNKNLYNGKIFCADSNDQFFEKGKIYEVKNGDLIVKEAFCGTFTSFDQIVSLYKDKAAFIEVKQ